MSNAHTLLQTLAARIGSEPESGCLGLRFGERPFFGVEACGDHALVAHARLDREALFDNEPDPAPLVEALAFNGRRFPCVVALDPQDGGWTAQRHIEVTPGTSCDAIIDVLREFSAELHALALPAEPEAPTDADVPLASPSPLAGPSADELHTFENLWADFVYDHRLAGSQQEPRDELGWHLAPDEGGFITVRPVAGGQVLVKALVGLMPLHEDLDDSALYRELLKTHFSGEPTEGAAFAIDPESGDLVLLRLVPLEGLRADTLALAVDATGELAFGIAGQLKLELPSVADAGA